MARSPATTLHDKPSTRQPSPMRRAAWLVWALPLLVTPAAFADATVQRATPSPIRFKHRPASWFRSERVSFDIGRGLRLQTSDRRTPRSSIHREYCFSQDPPLSAALDRHRPKVDTPTGYSVIMLKPRGRAPQQVAIDSFGGRHTVRLLSGPDWIASSEQPSLKRAVENANKLLEALLDDHALFGDKAKLDRSLPEDTHWLRPSGER